jgi:hypothetical protein
MQGNLPNRQDPSTHDPDRAAFSRSAVLGGEIQINNVVGPPTTKLITELVVVLNGSGIRRKINLRDNSNQAPLASVV